jgi:hypothetical protein
MSSVVRAADAERGVDHGTGATEISWVERKGGTHRSARRAFGLRYDEGRPGGRPVLASGG